MIYWLNMLVSCRRVQLTLTLGACTRHSNSIREMSCSPRSRSSSNNGVKRFTNSSLNCVKYVILLVRFCSVVALLLLKVLQSKLPKSYRIVSTFNIDCLADCKRCSYLFLFFIHLRTISPWARDVRLLQLMVDQLHIWSISPLLKFRSLDVCGATEH